jgi:predicted nucleic acid-binding protein
MRFFDASALVKRYVRESGTPTVRRLLRESRAVVSRLSEAEIRSAVHRRKREGALTHAQQRRALNALRADLLRLEIVELSPKVVAAVHPLLGRHFLRAADSLQLASAIVLRDTLGTEFELVTYDQRLHAAARLEGFRVRPQTLPQRPARRRGLPDTSRGRSRHPVRKAP